MTVTHNPIFIPGPPVDPDDIALICGGCNGRVQRSYDACPECGGYGYFASANSVRRFNSYMDQVEAVQLVA